MILRRPFMCSFCELLVNDDHVQSTVLDAGNKETNEELLPTSQSPYLGRKVDRNCEEENGPVEEEV
jgi:hypothetical protein